MKTSQTAGNPVKGNNVAVATEEQPYKTVYAYGTVTEKIKRKDVTRRVAIAGVQVSPTAMRIGKAVCSNKDRYIKSKGRDMAESRAKSKTPEEILYLTDDTSVNNQFIARVSKIIKLASRKTKAVKAEAIL